MNDWDNYRFILSLARQHTLRGAAAELGVNHSTVSRKLAWINKHESNDVFRRSAQGYCITEYGQTLLDAALQMESLVLSARRKNKAHNEKSLTGEVSVALSLPIAQFILADALTDFKAHFPNIKLIIDASESNVDLDQSEAEIVLRSANQPPEHWVGKRLFPYAVGFYANSNYFKATNPDNYVWIGASSDNDTSQWLQQTPFANCPVNVIAGDYHMRYLALSNGMGLGRAACFMADQNPNLQRIQNTDVFFSLDFWVLTHPDLLKSAMIKAVMQYFIDAFESKRALIQGELA